MVTPGAAWRATLSGRRSYLNMPGKEWCNDTWNALQLLDIPFQALGAVGVRAFERANNRGG